jgi:hypothetical protein
MDEREGILMEGRGEDFKIPCLVQHGRGLMEVTCKIIFFTLVIFEVILIIQVF